MVPQIEILVVTYLINSKKGKEFESFCLALDESNDTSNTAQLSIVIRGITIYFGGQRT
jgi:hypothetical protein